MGSVLAVSIPGWIGGSTDTWRDRGRSFRPLGAPEPRSACHGFAPGGNPRLATMSAIRAFINHPAGPLTIHFWAPTFKWAITLANISDFQRPIEQISLPQQLAVAGTGMIWVRYSTQITPVNYNLMTVIAFMAATGLYQITVSPWAPMGRSSGPAH